MTYDELSEYSDLNNFGELMGIDLEANDAEISRKLSQMSPVKRLQTLHKIAPVRYPSRGSRAEMEKRFRELPPETRSQLQSGRMRLGDSLIYSIKPLNGSKTIKMFEPQDDKEVGVSNIANAKLPKNEALAVAGIYLLVGVVANPQNPGQLTPDEIKAARYIDIGTVPALANGEWTFAANGSTFVKACSCRKFVVGSNTLRDPGYYRLDNARIVEPDVEIEFTIELPTTYGIPANSFVYVGLDGTKPHA